MAQNIPVFDDQLMKMTNVLIPPTSYVLSLKQTNKKKNWSVEIKKISHVYFLY